MRKELVSITCGKCLQEMGIILYGKGKNIKGALCPDCYRLTKEQ